MLLSWLLPFRAVAFGLALLADVGLGEFFQRRFIYEPAVGYFDGGEFALADKAL